MLDEPTSQLDPVAGDELIWLLRRLNEEWGVAVVLAEHRLERCLAAADRVVAMDAGSITFDGLPRDFLAWAIDADPALATPAARLFSRAGIEPLPVGVRDARQILGDATVVNEASSPSLTRTLNPPLRGGFPRAKRSGGASTPPSTALAARNLWVELDRGDEIHEVLRGIDVEIAQGERVALMGRNGAGKSTFLRTAAGLLKPIAGKVEVPQGVALLTQNPGDFLVRERVGEELPGEEGREALAGRGAGAPGRCRSAGPVGG